MPLGLPGKPFAARGIAHGRSPAPPKVFLARRCAWRITHGRNPAARMVPGFCVPTTRNGAGLDVELRRGLDDTQQFLASFGDLHLRRLGLPEEGTKPLVAGRLGVHGVMVAVVCAVQSVVEDAYEVVVFVLGAGGAFAEILHLRVPFRPICATGQPFPTVGMMTPAGVRR